MKLKERFDRIESVTHAKTLKRKLGLYQGNQQNILKALKSNPDISVTISNWMYK